MCLKQVIRITWFRWTISKYDTEYIVFLIIMNDRGQIEGGTQAELFRATTEGDQYQHRSPATTTSTGYDRGVANTHHSINDVDNVDLTGTRKRMRDGVANGPGNYQNTYYSNSRLHGHHWFEYDADVVDNLSKTKRFASDCMSDDIVSKMSLSEMPSSPDLGLGGTQSPSPLSRRKSGRHGRTMCHAKGSGAMVLNDDDFELTPRTTISRVSCMIDQSGPMPQKQLLDLDEDQDDALFTTPRKSRLQQKTNDSMITRSMRRISQHGDALPLSPSDVKVDGADLRRTALVRLALKNIGETRDSTDQ